MFQSAIVRLVMTAEDQTFPISVGKCGTLHKFGVGLLPVVGLSDVGPQGPQSVGDLTCRLLDRRGASLHLIDEASVGGALTSIIDNNGFCQLTGVAGTSVASGDLIWIKGTGPDGYDGYLHEVEEVTTDTITLTTAYSGDAGPGMWQKDAAGCQITVPELHVLDSGTVVTEVPWLAETPIRFCNSDSLVSNTLRSNNLYLEVVGGAMGLVLVVAFTFEDPLYS